MPAFDPTRQRAALADFPVLPQALVQAKGPLNLVFWRNAFAQVAQSYLVGLAASPDTRELLALTRRVLSEARASGAIDAHGEADAHAAASALEALALAEWLATDARQRPLFDHAYALHRRHFAEAFGKKKPSLLHGIFPVVTAACAAERFDEARRFLDTTVPEKKLDAARGRTVAELALALATLPPPQREPAERFLRANLREPLEHGGWVRASLMLYLASLAGVPGSAQALLEGAAQALR